MRLKFQTGGLGIFDYHICFQTLQHSGSFTSLEFTTIGFASAPPSRLLPGFVIQQEGLKAFGLIRA